MSYKINELNIENDRFIANVTIIMKDGAEIACNVPVIYPKTKEEVIAAIEFREVNEAKKYDSAPVLEAIKAELLPIIDILQTAAAVK